MLRRQVWLQDFRGRFAHSPWRIETSRHQRLYFFTVETGQVRPRQLQARRINTKSRPFCEFRQLFGRSPAHDLGNLCRGIHKPADFIRQGEDSSGVALAAVFQGRQPIPINPAQQQQRELCRPSLLGCRQHAGVEEFPEIVARLIASFAYPLAHFAFVSPASVFGRRQRNLHFLTVFGQAQSIKEFKLGHVASLGGLKEARQFHRGCGAYAFAGGNLSQR